MKVLLLIEFLGRYGKNDVRYFTHRSERCRQEVFLALGQVLKAQVVKAVKNGRYFSLLCDEVSDIAVMEQLVTFVQYVSDGQIYSKFLSVRNLLEHHKETALYALYALYAKVQMKLNSLNLNEKAKKAVVRKIQKACRTRWLSLGKAVKSLKQDYPAVLTTLKLLDDEHHDAAAKGLFIRLNSFKFIATIYILNQVIPILDTVSETFQKGSITFSLCSKSSICKDETSRRGLEPQSHQRSCCRSSTGWTSNCPRGRCTSDEESHSRGR